VSGVLTSNGGPVLRAIAELRRTVPGPRLEVTIASTGVDASGRFTFPAVPAGEYTLFGEVLALPRQPGSGQAGTVQIVVGNADVHDVVITMRPALLVTGSVETESGDGPAPEQLQRLRIEAQALDGSRARSVATSVYDDGRFVLADLAPGPYHLRADLSGAPGWFLESIVHEGVDVSDRSLQIDRHLSRLVVRLTREPARVTGQVRTNGRPDPDASVLAFPAGEDPMPELGGRSRRLMSVRVDAQGSYELLGLPAGRYRLAAIPERAVGNAPTEALLRRLSSSATMVQINKGHQNVDLTTTAIAP
jgi:hypothetical protein